MSWGKVVSQAGAAALTKRDVFLLLRLARGEVRWVQPAYVSRFKRITHLVCYLVKQYLPSTPPTPEQIERAVRLYVVLDIVASTLKMVPKDSSLFRQTQVLLLYVGGFSNEEMMQAFCVTERSLQSHLLYRARQIAYEAFMSRIPLEQSVQFVTKEIVVEFEQRKRSVSITPGETPPSLTEVLTSSNFISKGSYGVYRWQKERWAVLANGVDLYAALSVNETIRVAGIQQKL